MANPAVREAAGRAAKRRVREHYQWNGIALDIEQLYFEMMGWRAAPFRFKKPSVSAPISPNKTRQKVG
jgi:hypothetical protein